MLNYEEIITQAQDHRTLLLTTAEQQRLAQAVAPIQPLRTRIGQQLIEWARQLQGKPQPLPVTPATEGF